MEKQITYDDNGERHSFNDKPAYVFGGIQIWYNHGLIHRDNGPAYVTPTFSACYKDGQINSQGDNPAIVSQKPRLTRKKNSEVYRNGKKISEIMKIILDK